MYLPGSYLVYPTPIHLHPFPEPPPPGAPAGVQLMRPAGLSPTPSVQSRDLKFGVERILSGEVSRPARASSPRGEGRCCRAGGGSPALPASPRSAEGSSQHSSSATTTPLPDAPGNGGSSPPAPYQSLSPPASRPLVVMPRGLLACTGDAPVAYHHHPPLPSPFATPSSSPASSPYPRPEDPLGPAQGGHRLAAAPGAPTYAAYATAGLFLHHHRHQHHPAAAAVLQYPPPLYPQGGSGGGLVLGAGRGHHHVEEAAAPIGGSATCIIPVSSGGGSGGGAGGGGKRKRSWSRAVFSNLQRKGLEKRFQLQKYITKPDRRQLAATLGLTDAQVKVWFQNRRMKWRHSKEGKQQQQVVVVTTEPSLVPPMPPSPLHMLSSHQDSEQGDHLPSTVTDTGFGPPEWEGEESRSTNRPDSTQKGLEEEEIQVDS